MIKKFLILFYLPFSLSAAEPNFYKSWSLFLGGFTEALTGVTSSQTLTQMLFNSFSDISAPIYSFEVPYIAPIEAGFGIDLGGGRKVIYNQNIDNSYTVIDKFLVGIRPEFTGMWSGFKASVRGRVNVYVTNVRQVGPTEYDLLAPLDRKFEDIKEKFRLEKNRKYNEAEIKVDSDTYANFLPSNREKVERNASFGRIWNPITMAFRLPLTPRKAEKLGENEIIGYTLLGGLELGVGLGVGFVPGFGAGFDPVGTVLRTGVDASIYFKGTYELVVLREKPQKPGDNFVRVRVGRVRGLGYTLGLGSEGATGINDLTSGKMGPLDGSFIWSVAGFLVSVRPFRVEWDQSWWWIFDQVYRFDLNNKEAREAYQKAALGSFKLAEKLALDEKGELRENSPVTRLLKVKEKRDIRGHRRSIRLFLAKLQRDGIIRNSDKILVDEKLDETYIYETEALNTRYWQVLFAIKEGRSHKFLVKTDLKKFNEAPKPPEALTLLVEAHREDSITTNREYREYIYELESALNKPDFFPKAPLVVKKKDNLSIVGGMDFDYQLKFNWPQVEKLINYPEEKMWFALVEAFHAQGQGWEDPKIRKKLIAKSVGIYMGTLPLTLVGSKFPPKDAIIIASIKFNYWKKLKENYLKGIKELSQALGNFFNSGDYGHEMVYLLRIANRGEKIPYKFKIFNPLLVDNPNLAEDGIGEILDPLEQSMNVNLDQYQGNFEKVTITFLVAELISNEYVRLTFYLDKEPQTVFFNLQKTNLSGSLTNASLGSVVMKNNNHIFKQGKNVIMVKLHDRRHPLNNLVNQLKTKKSLFIPNQYKFSVAASLDGKKYGYSTSDFFRLIYTEDPKSLGKYIAYTLEDFDLCLGRGALDLMLFLGERPLIMCPETAPHNPDGTCVSGMYPYDFFKNRPLEENIAKRNEWILKKCPLEGSEKFIKRVIDIDNVCLGKKAQDLIGLLGDRTFYVCPPNAPRNPDGTCISGIIPYQNQEEEDNVKFRNQWISKYCPN
jgi:hypothetical protein